MSKSKKKMADLGGLARVLLIEMASKPEVVEYNFRVLGHVFNDEGIALLDVAYAELMEHGYVDHANAVVSFFGVPKTLYRINEHGQKAAQRLVEDQKGVA